MRLVMKAVLTVLEISDGEFFSLSRGGRIMGVRRITSVNGVRVFRSSVISITFTWICTKMSGS